MREVLVDIAKRLGELPATSGELARKRGEVSDALHRVLDEAKKIEIQIAGEVAVEKNGDDKPRFPNEAARNAETSRRLAADEGYRNTRRQVEELRKQLRELDAQIDEIGRRHRSDSNMSYLVASLLGAGLKDEAGAVLAAYAQGVQAASSQDGATAPEAPAPAPAGGGEGGGDGLETGIFKVLEARESKTPGTIRAYCESETTGKTAVFAKNGEGKTLAGAVGKQVELKYRRVDRGLFAVSVRPVA